MHLTRSQDWAARLTIALVLIVPLSGPAAAHGADSTGGAFGLSLSLVVIASVVASLVGGGVMLAVFGHRRSRGVVPLLFFALGGLSIIMAADGVLTGAGLGLVTGSAFVALFRGRGFTDCGGCAEAALGAVTLHRGFEGIVLATVYAADATLGILGAGVLAVHAAAETAAVGSLYATRSDLAFGAVVLVQVGFIAGVIAGWFIIDAVPTAVKSGLLALVGVVLLTVGAQEAMNHNLQLPSIAPE